jgi:hypothetical protein
MVAKIRNVNIARDRFIAGAAFVCRPTTAHQPRRASVPNDATTPGRRRLHALVMPHCLQ